MTKVLILGANGMAGHVIYTYLKEQDVYVRGTARKPEDYGNDYILDVTDFCSLERILENDFSYVINCVGVLNRQVDNDLYNGIMVNSLLPHFLSKLSSKMGFKLIHISTDCVFQGDGNGWYTENDAPNATSKYGMSKVLGEISDGKNLTLRTSLVGPELRNEGIGLFKWFMGQEHAEGYSNVFWSGITTLQLAKIIREYITSETKENGVFHVTNGQKISKYNLLKLFNDYFRDGQVEISENELPRSDKSLLTSRDCAWNIVPSYEKMIEEMRDWINNHPELYKDRF